ncbi:MAG: uracil-DNA glycosylase family protein [Anaerolineales bacterium]|nr:uracil-DNA glycosylase family protein [Anaerolineales bacterium]MCB8954574.1 uracil-DNA glycosylase family protein [Ardenticatenales bacterium]
MLQQLHEEMRACRRCLEAGHDIVPGAVFQGRLGARVMLIGQAPGVTEVEAKRPFNAGSGRRLFQWLGAAGWEEDTFRQTQYMTAVTKCYPGKSGNGKGDRVPSRDEQAFCRPFLEREMALINPRLIIPVGGLAIKLFFPARLSLAQIIGRAAYFPPQSVINPVNFDLRQAEMLDAFDAAKPRAGRWLVPLPHPSGASLWPNRPANQALIDRAIGILAQIREML